MDWKTRDNKQCWSDAKDCIRYLIEKKRSFCQPSVICYDPPDRRNDDNDNN